MFITAALFCPILAPGLLSLNNTIKFLFYRESGTKWKMLKLALFLYYLISFVSPQLNVSILQAVSVILNFWWQVYNFSIQHFCSTAFCYTVSLIKQCTIQSLLKINYALIEDYSLGTLIYY